MALALSLGLEEPAKALGYRGLSRYNLGDADGLDDLRRALALTIERGQGREAAILYNNLAYSTWVIDGPAAALGVYREGIEFAERRGIAEIAIWMSNGSLCCPFDLGYWDEILDAARSLTDALPTSGSVQTVFEPRRFQARVIALRGGADACLCDRPRWIARASGCNGRTAGLVAGWENDRLLRPRLRANPRQQGPNPARDTDRS